MDNRHEVKKFANSLKFFSLCGGRQKAPLSFPCCLEDEPCFGPCGAEPHQGSWPPGHPKGDQGEPAVSFTALFTKAPSGLYLSPQTPPAPAHQLAPHVFTQAAPAEQPASISAILIGWEACPDPTNSEAVGPSCSSWP